MRMTPERKAETRQRILEAALRLFRQHGIDAVGVDAIMHAAGLTHGGFYAHFESKEALVAEAAAASLARSAARWERLSEGPDRDAALASIVGNYLDQAHVAGVERGCVLTTLGPEAARRGNMRPLLTDSIIRMTEALGRCLPGGRQRALATLCSMVGAVVLARLSADDDFSAEILSAARGVAGLPKSAQK